MMRRRGMSLVAVRNLCTAAAYGRVPERSNPMTGIALLLFGLSVVSSAAAASDFTPLFVLFVELPIFGTSILFLLVCFGAPKPGLVLSSLLFVGSLIVVGWASGGYLEDAGGFLLSSLLVDIAAILIALKRINAAKRIEPGEDS